VELARTKLASAPGALSLLALAIMASPFAMADESGWYAGINVGQSNAKIDDDSITRGLLGNGFSSISIKDEDSDLGYKIFGGYQFNKYLALEGGYFDLGSFGFTATTVPAGTLVGNIEINGLNLDLVGIVPIAKRISALGRVGASYAQAKDTFTGTGSVNILNSNPSKRDTNYKFGLGLQYDFTEALAIRAEGERYRINDAVGNKGDIDLVSVGLIYRFGVKGAATAPPPSKPFFAPPSRAETPPPPVRVASIAPVLVIATAPLGTERYCSILDLQFEINKDDVQREDKEKFAVVGTFMTKYPNTTAVIEGHSDNVGQAEQNMKLSVQRAESVVSYLADSFRIARSRLTAVGYGEARPIADNATEEGKRLNRRTGAIIACASDIEGLKVNPARLTMAMGMEFDEDKTDVKPQYSNDLRKVADFLKANPSVTATVEGHAGNLKSTPELAMEISQRRAANVVSYLVDNFGITRSRLSAEGFGQTRRFAYNTSLEGQQENRRVNIIFNYPTGATDQATR